jgi:hypothetical protein
MLSALLRAEGTTPRRRSMVGSAPRQLEVCLGRERLGRSAPARLQSRGSMRRRLTREDREPGRARRSCSHRKHASGLVRPSPVPRLRSRPGGGVLSGPSSFCPETIGWRVIGPGRGSCLHAEAAGTRRARSGSKRKWAQSDFMPRRSPRRQRLVRSDLGGGRSSRPAASAHAFR